MGRKYKDLTGQIFTYLTVISDAGWSTSRHHLSNCICICGNKCIVKNGSLKNGTTKSCGCMQHQREDLTGQRFNYLTVISDAGFSDYGVHQSNVECDCGNIRVVANNGLKTGNTKSCGDTKNCPFAFDIASNATQTHGLTNTREYEIWISIKQRCINPNNKSYPDYGGRGITIYYAWFDFQVFYDYLQTLSETRIQFEARTGQRSVIDRINNNGNYEPDNIRWVTYHESNQNTRQNVFDKKLVKFIKFEYKRGKTGAEIIKILKNNYNYQGGNTAVRNIINGIKWIDVTIDKELVEYQQFGTINGIVIVNDIVIPNNF